MDLSKAMGQFFNERGEITLDPRLSLAGLCELLYQADVAQGGGEKVVLRQWDFSTDADGVQKKWTRTGLNTRIKAVAGRLQQVAGLGERVAILGGNSAEYIYAFMGALYAGLVPVPLYDPTEPGHADHLRAVFADAEPTIVLTETTCAPAVRAHFAGLPGPERPRIIAVDALPDSMAQSWTNPLASEEAKKLAAAGATPLDMPAFLQYTSGSTRTPAGVQLTNRSILTNVLQIFRAAALKTPLRLVAWIPLHHDMGIILAAFVTILGLENEIMTPRDFIQRPGRWIRQLNSAGEDAGEDSEKVAVYSVVPNFALELAVRYGRPAEGEQLDLSAIDGLIIGSEPVTRRSVESFLEAFSPYGLRRDALRPSYGLAEASLLVTTPQTPERPVISAFDRDALAAGRVEHVDPDSPQAVNFISNGQVVAPQRLTVVDPETRSEVADGTVGELWTHGDNAAAGYLDRPEETAATFANTLAGRLPENSHAEGAPDDGWLATGDLGAIVDGEVYVTGRLKDLIVVAGRNHYPQDVEYTVGAATGQVNSDAVAAFAVPGDDVEQLVVLAERADGAQPADDAEAVRAIRAAVSATHGLAPAEVRLLEPGRIARSSSAKIARRVAARDFEAGKYD